ncbi:MAG: HPr family phosphocarrier protein [Lachnospiraceae bacterium]|jgi:phosphocarrier protein HPr|nr:HPr family phosphocarrier protein [Lachnospiraceae bacterium]
MNEKYIKLSDTEEVCDFVRAAGRCDFDIDISNQYAVIDAKSILGVMALGMGQPLAVTYGGKNRGFEHVLSKYTVV